MTVPHGEGSEPPAISGREALIGVLTRPAETFRRLGGRPPLLPPYLVLMLAGIITFAITMPFTLATLDQGMAQAIQQPSAQEAPPEMMAIAKLSAVVTAGVGALVGPWLVGLLVALLALFIGQFQGGGIPLPSYMGMVGFARLPLAILGLLSGAWTLATKESLDISLRVLVGAGASPYLQAALALINPFLLWYYALLAIGSAALLGRRPAGGIALPAFLFVLNLGLAIAAVAIGRTFVPRM